MRFSTRLACERPDSLEGMYGFSVGGLIGVVLGFMLGVGCALAVMYSIYLGGYRAALGDAKLKDKPKQYFQELAKVEKMQPKAPVA